MDVSVIYGVCNPVHLMELETKTWTEFRASTIDLDIVHMEIIEAKK